jgi:hypothetical protein
MRGEVWYVLLAGSACPSATIISQEIATEGQWKQRTVKLA